MSEAAQRFPLSWPAGWRRTPGAQRRRAAFRSYRQQISVTQALGRLERELRLLDARAEILSTNVRLGLRGAPLSREPEPADPGAAVYFELAGKPRCLACDRWERVADNVAAIAQHIDALRRIERYGVGTMEQAFAGYAALPPTAVDWWLVLGVKESASLAEVEAAFRDLAHEHHPDRGGRHEDMARLTEARAVARRVILAR
jgi:DnaJ-like protein